MHKKIIKIEIVLILSILSVLALVIYIMLWKPMVDYLAASKEKEKLVGHYISTPVFWGTNMYFAAGTCLYRWDTIEKTSHQLICDEERFGLSAVDEHHIYAQLKNSLLTLDPSTGELKRRTSLVDVNVAGHFAAPKVFEDKVISMSTSRLRVFDAQSGKLNWRSEFNWMHGYIVYDDDIWYVLDERSDTAPENGNVIARDLDTGRVEYTTNLSLRTRFDQLVYVDENWLLGIYDVNWTYKHIFAVDRSNPGSITWFTGFSCVGFMYPITHVASEDIFVFKCEDIDEGDRVIAININSGESTWTFDASSDDRTTVYAEPIVILSLNAQDALPKLLAMNAALGTVIWEYALEQSSYPAWRIHEGAVYVGNKNTIDVLDLESGTLLWQVEVDSEYEYFLPDS